MNTLRKSRLLHLRTRLLKGNAAFKVMSLPAVTFNLLFLLDTQKQRPIWIQEIYLKDRKNI